MTPASAPGADWPQFHFDAAHTGLNASATTITKLNVGGLTKAWSAIAGGPFIKSSPAVSNGIVYVGSFNQGLHAFDALTGAHKWTAAQAGAAESSPGVVDGAVYVGSADGGGLYSFNALTGSKNWVANAANAAYTSPALSGGAIYYNAGNGRLFALDASGTTKWTFPGGPADGAPAVTNGVVYEPAGDGYLYALDAGSAPCAIVRPVPTDVCPNSELWKVQINPSDQVAASPTVAGGIVYIGAVNGDLYALSASNGAPAWTAHTGGEIRSAAAVANGVVYIGSFDHKIYAFDAATGAVLWTATTGDLIVGSPAVANGVVYATSMDGHLYAFDAAGSLGCSGPSGPSRICAPLFDHDFGVSTGSSPAVAGDFVYVAAGPELFAFALPTVRISDASATEGTSSTGTTPMTFTVSLSAPSSSTVTVHYSTANGTAVGSLGAATAPGDYASISPTQLTFQPNQTSKTVTVQIKRDALDEPDERLFVNLSGPVNATVATANGTLLDGQGVGRIIDDDLLAKLRISDKTVTEGTSATSTTPVTFTITLSPASGKTVAVDYATANGTVSGSIGAATAADYAAVIPTQVVFQPLQTTKTVTIQVKRDALDEPAERFFVNLSNPINATTISPPNGTQFDGQGIGTIHDDDAEPTVAISDESVTEGTSASGTTPMTFAINLSAASGQIVTVDYKTADGAPVGVGAASAPNDYTAIGLTQVTFQPLQTTKYVTIQIHRDALHELDEQFFVNLSGAQHAGILGTNGSLLDGHGIATIVDDDPPTVSTLAGSSPGFANGQGTAAKFHDPRGVAVSASGTLFVADYGNNRIRKITAAGQVSTFAGSMSGFANGQGAAARFAQPTGVAVDSAGNVYVADYNNHRIRKITPGGVVTTLAGSGTPGFANGQGAAAQFAHPYGVAVDSAGNVYVADSDNNRIRKITPGGLVSTLAGSGVAGSANGQGAAAQFSHPTGVAVDIAGKVYVADSGSHRIRKITPAGLVSTLAGLNAGYADGQGSAAAFFHPRGVALDAAGNVYVVDFGNRVRFITPGGMVSTLAGSGVAGSANGNGTNAQFNAPEGVAVNNAGTVYVADTGNNRLRKLH